jgi:hypothetical protein
MSPFMWIIIAKTIWLAVRGQAVNTVYLAGTA